MSITWGANLAKTHLDAGSDDPAQARAELEAIVDRLNIRLTGTTLLQSTDLASLGGQVVESDFANVFTVNQTIKRNNPSLQFLNTGFPTGGFGFAAFNGKFQLDDRDDAGNFIRWTIVRDIVNNGGFRFLNSPDMGTDTINAPAVYSGNSLTITQADKATQPQAEAGVDNVNYMTALRTAQAMAPDFESAEQTLAKGSATTVAHGLGVQPARAQLVMRCVTAEGGYSIGDEIVRMNAVVDSFDGGGAGMRGMTIAKDSTSLVLLVGDSESNILRKDTGALFSYTLANWKLVARAWK